MRSVKKKATAVVIWARSFSKVFLSPHSFWKRNCRPPTVPVCLCVTLTSSKDRYLAPSATEAVVDIIHSLGTQDPKGRSCLLSSCCLVCTGNLIASPGCGLLINYVVWTTPAPLEPVEDIPALLWGPDSSEPLSCWFLWHQDLPNKSVTYKSNLPQCAS